MFTKEEKIENLRKAIGDSKHFVMAGSMSSFHEHFDSMFSLAVLLNTDTKLKIQRVNQRAIKRFGDRVLVGGDMYGEHKKFLADVSGYENGQGNVTLESHREWLNGIGCKVLELDGEKALKESSKVIIKAYRLSLR